MFNFIKNKFKNQLKEDFSTLDRDVKLLIYELGQVFTHCDKCTSSSVSACIKCNGTGVIKRSQLMSWPW